MVFTGAMPVLDAGPGRLENRERNGLPVIRFGREAEQRVDALVVFFQLQIPAPFLVPSKTDAAVGNPKTLGGRIVQDRFPLGVVGLLAQIRRPQESTGNIGLAVLFEHDDKRQIRVGLGVIGEVVHLAVDIEFLENDMGHGHGQGRIRARPGGQPGIGELDVFGIIGRHRSHLGAPVAGLGVEMRIRGAGHGQIGAPHDEIRGLVPVGTFGDIGLLAPDLGRGRRQIAVPIVKTDHGAADEGKKTGP